MHQSHLKGEIDGVLRPLTDEVCTWIADHADARFKDAWKNAYCTYVVSSVQALEKQ